MLLFIITEKKKKTSITIQAFAETHKPNNHYNN
jgi:hypothetical protein